jgi:uncharacterized protein (DUF58 family)
MLTISQVLSSDTISRLNNLFLKAKFVVEGFIVGLHKSPYHGFSIEFSEHRAYGKGDAIKHIDWKLWAKTDKYFVKQFEEETNLKSYILLDQSASMNYKSNQISKLDYSKLIAASLGYLMLKQQDAIGLTLFDNQIRYQIRPKSKRSHLYAILSKMEKIKVGKQTHISPVLHKTAEIIKKRGLIILISDLFDDPKKVMAGLKHFRYNGHEVIVFHILDQQEMNLNFNKRTRFQDLETSDEIITDPWHIKNDYKKNMEKFCNYYKIQCRQNKIDYVMLTTNTSLDVVLSEYLLKRKKLN